VLLSDFLFEQNRKNWAELLSEWSPPLPHSFTVWIVNRFDDVFAVYEDGSVLMLDLGTGVLQRLADRPRLVRNEHARVMKTAEVLQVT